MRTWYVTGRRIWRASINGDLPGAEDEFPCLNDQVAIRLANVLNEELRATPDLLVTLKAIADDEKYPPRQKWWDIAVAAVERATS